MSEITKTEERSSALELSFQMGRVLLENGAEISRVQETMERVAEAFHTEDFSVYVLTNAVFVSGRENGVDKHTKLKYVPSNSIHFGRICAVNQLSREIAEGKRTVEEAFELLDKAREIAPTRLLPSLFACAVGSAGFCYLFGCHAGAGLLDALYAFFCGFVLELFLHFANKRKLPKSLTNLCASAMVALLTLLIGEGVNVLHQTFGLYTLPDPRTAYIIIGSIIRLVPGVALTTSIRDFFNGDYLSGTIRMVDAILVGGCIALGVGVTIRYVSPLLIQLKHYVPWFAWLGGI